MKITFGGISLIQLVNTKRNRHSMLILINILKTNLSICSNIKLMLSNLREFNKFKLFKINFFFNDFH